MTEVNKAALLEWVEELETTDKPQAKKLLNIVDQGYCCLGIACELFADRLGMERVVEDAWSAGDVSAVRYRKGEDDWGSRAFLPATVAQFLGVGIDGFLMVSLENGERHDVTFLNDVKGLSFKEIAALIRKEYDL